MRAQSSQRVDPTQRCPACFPAGVFLPPPRLTSVREDTSHAFTGVTPDEAHGLNNSGQERRQSGAKSWTSGRTKRATLKEVDSQPARSLFLHPRAVTGVET